MPGEPMGGYYDPPLGAECQHFGKKAALPYSHAGFSDFFLTNKVATKLPTRKKVGGRSVYICAIISVLKRKESNDAKATY